MGIGLREIRASGSASGAGNCESVWDWKGFGHLWLVLLESGWLRLSQNSSCPFS